MSNVSLIDGHVDEIKKCPYYDDQVWGQARCNATHNRWNCYCCGDETLCELHKEKEDEKDTTSAV